MVCNRNRVSNRIVERQATKLTNVQPEEGAGRGLEQFVEIAVRRDRLCDLQRGLVPSERVSQGDCGNAYP